MITLLDSAGPAIWRASWQAAALAVLVVLLLRCHQVVAHQHPVHRRPRRHRRHLPAPQLVHDALRTPTWADPVLSGAL